MTAIIIGVIALVCVLCGTFFGIFLRYKLPGHHLSSDSKDAVKMASGLIATLSALVLGLLVSSAKNTFDDMSDSITHSSTKLIMLDRTLALYGPQTRPIRDQVRQAVIRGVAMIWPEQKTQIDGMAVFEKSAPTMELAIEKMRMLTPENDLQRARLAEATQLCKELLQTRWLMIEQAQVVMPAVFIVVLLFWLTILFGSIGLFAPANKTVLTALVVCAMSVAGAVFLVEEMNKPLKGIVKVSNAPLIKAIEHMGKDVPQPDLLSQE